MGVLYEHWRPDLNECFYVGVSWKNPETRPYEMKDRNEDHIRVQEELSAQGLAPEVRVIDCPSLIDEELGELEAFQIAYWKDLIGDHLVNKSKGGEGFNIDFDDKTIEELRRNLINYYNSPEGKIAKNKLSIFQKELRPKFINSPRGQQWRKNESSRMNLFYETPEGRKFKAEQSIRMQGENHPCAKISEKTAQDILDFNGTHKEAAEKYGVSYNRARLIRTRKQWKHLKPTKN